MIFQSKTRYRCWGMGMVENFADNRKINFYLMRWFNQEARDIFWLIYLHEDNSRNFSVIPQRLKLNLSKFPGNFDEKYEEGRIKIFKIIMYYPFGSNRIIFNICSTVYDFLYISTWLIGSYF